MNTIDLIKTAALAEHTNSIRVNPPEVSVRTRGNLPKRLKKHFGGTVFKHKGKKNGKPRNWFRVKHQKAEILLRAIFPFLENDKKRVARFLLKLGPKNGRPKNQRDSLRAGRTH